MAYLSLPGTRVNEDNSITTLEQDMNQRQPPVISQQEITQSAVMDFFKTLEKFDKVIVNQHYEKEEVNTGKETANNYDVILGQQRYLASEGILSLIFLILHFLLNFLPIINIKSVFRQSGMLHTLNKKAFFF